jgi:predicted nucleic acid-binding protein
MVERELQIFAFLETTESAAKQAGVWRYAYARQGRQIAITDALIAATAYLNQATIVTGNIRDYPMPEVSLLPSAPNRRRRASLDHSSTVIFKENRFIRRR